MKKSRPKTGEKREVKRPLNIDRMPVEVRDAILQLRDAGKTWPEIEELSSLPYNEAWSTKGGGFVNWEGLTTPVLELFPDLKLPHSNLHRWYDLRVSQVVAETMARSAQAREIAAAFAKSIVAGDDDAVMNAARDQIMSVLAEDATPKGRMKAASALIALAEMMQQRRANEIKERKVAVDERKIKAFEDREALMRKKLEAETDKAASKLKKGELTVKDINRLRERVFGLPPVEAPTHV
jgi:ketosteroid isomerase-like protein